MRRELLRHEPVPVYDHLHHMPFNFMLIGLFIGQDEEQIKATIYEILYEIGVRRSLTAAGICFERTVATLKLWVFTSWGFLWAMTLSISGSAFDLFGTLYASGLEFGEIGMNGVRRSLTVAGICLERTVATLNLWVFTSWRFLWAMALSISGSAFDLFVTLYASVLEFGEIRINGVRRSLTAARICLERTVATLKLWVFTSWRFLWTMALSISGSAFDLFVTLYAFGLEFGEIGMNGVRRSLTAAGIYSEKKLATLTLWVFTSWEFLWIMTLGTIVYNTLFVWFLTQGGHLWWRLLIVSIWSLIKVFLPGRLLLLKYRGRLSGRSLFVSPSVKGGAHPNQYSVKKGLGSGFSMVLLAGLSSVLDDLSGLWSSVFCASLYMHIIHLMVLLRRREDYEFSNGVLQAYAVVVAGMVPMSWHLLYLVVVVFVLSAYQALLKDADFPKDDVERRVQSRL